MRSRCSDEEGRRGIEIATRELLRQLIRRRKVYFDPSGGPFVVVGSKIYWNEIHNGVEESTPLTVKRIMDRGAEGLFVEVE
jgi:hypothetical protein